MTNYLPIKMPEEFVLQVPGEEGGWVDYGQYRADRFELQDDGSYLHASDTGSPLVLRCVGQEGDVIRTVDADDDVFVCRMRRVATTESA